MHYFPVTWIVLGYLEYVTIGGSRAGVTMECTYPQHKQIVEQLRLGSTFEQTIKYLDKIQVSYTIFPEHTKINRSLIDSRGYDAFPKISVSVIAEGSNVSRRGAYSSVITEYELLTLIFDADRQLSATSCKKIFTGP